MKILLAFLTVACIVVSLLVADVSGNSEFCKVAKSSIEGKRKNFDYAALTPKKTAKQEQEVAAASTAQTAGEESKTEIQRDNPVTLKCDEELNNAADKAAAKLAKEDKYEQGKAPLQKKYGENIAVFKAGQDANSKLDAFTVVYPDKKDKDNSALTKGKKPEDAIKEAIEIWYKEGQCYIFSKPEATVFEFVEHFTAMIWKDTAYIGVGVGTSSSGNVFVVVYFLTVSEIPPNVGKDMSFAANIPDPIRPTDFDFKKNCKGTIKLSSDVEPARKAVTAAEVMETSRDVMKSLVDPELIRKERNKIARLAMFICEQNDEAIQEKLRQWLTVKEGRYDPKTVSERIGKTLCSTEEKDTMFQAFACEYLKCVQKTSVENNIDYHLNSKKVRGIEAYHYGRKVAQHRCQRDYHSLANVGLSLNVMLAYPLLRNAQEKLEHKELDKCIKQEQQMTTGSWVVKNGKAKPKLTTVAVE